MHKIAAVPITTEALLKESPALLGFVSGIELLVLPELVAPMCELALLIVGTVAFLEERPTQFGFLFGEVHSGFGA
jgi:hypothetical protein